MYDKRAARHLAGAALAAALTDARARTWAVVDDLTDAQWRPPPQRGVNPVAWELAHLAWFAEFWVLRGPHGRAAQGHALAQRPARFAGPDAHFDSARLAHADRWTTPLPDRPALKAMLAGQLAAVVDAIPRDSHDAAAHEFHRLALFHEDMHAEAFCWLRARLGHAPPAGAAMPVLAASRQVALPGGALRLGGSEPGAFAFDNELPGREVLLREFEIDSAPVSAGAFLRFVEAGGYHEPAHWPGPAGTWIAGARAAHPARWRRAARGGWEARWFDRWLPLDPAAPLIHVNAFEAEAYCRWAGRRLPSAAEWEHAAPRIDWGRSVWEWTADAFAPYAGFAPGPYREYSEPWFGDHRELRGGAFATSERMHDPRFRNFFTPERTDIFAGFRTASR